MVARSRSASPPSSLPFPAKDCSRFRWRDHRPNRHVGGRLQSGLLYHYATEDSGNKWILVGVGFFGFLIAILCCFAAEMKSTGWRRILMLGAMAIVLDGSVSDIASSPWRLPNIDRGNDGCSLLGGIWLVSLMLWIANVAVADLIHSWFKNRAEPVVAQASSLYPDSIRLAITALAPLVAFYLIGPILPKGGAGPPSEWRRSKRE